MIYTFQDFQFDDSRWELSKHGELLPVAPRVMEMLHVLLRSAGRLVSKRELLETVWEGACVTPASVANAVRAARTCVGDTVNDQSCIKTVRGKGYLFVAPVDCRPSASPIIPPAVGPSPLLSVAPPRISLPSPAVDTLITHAHELAADLAAVLTNLMISLRVPASDAPSQAGGNGDLQPSKGADDRSAGN